MRSLSISRQIYLAIGSVLVLLVILAGLSYLATAKLAGIFRDYKATAQQTHVADKLFKDVVNAQVAASGYRLAPSDQTARVVWDRVDDITDGQRSAEAIFAGDQAAGERLRRVALSTQRYRDAFAEMTDLKLQSDAVIDELLVIGASIREKLTAIMDFAYENGDTWTGYDVGIVQQEFMRGRFNQDRYLITNDAETFRAAMAFIDAAGSRTEALRDRIYDPSIQRIAREARADMTAYMETAARNYNLISRRNDLRDRQLEQLGPKIKEELDDLVGMVMDRQQALGLNGSSKAESTMFLVAILSISAVVIGLTLAAFVARRISKSIFAMADSMTELAGGNLDIALNSAEHNHEIGMMARALDVFKLNARELRRSLDKERELNGLQRQFVSMVSHEFRTPLAIIDGHAQRLERRPDDITPDRVRKATRGVRKSVLRLTELMESVLSAARMEEGRIELQPVDFDIAEMVAEVCRNYADINASHTLDVEIDDLPKVWHGDVKLLRQVISNLLSNAIKYSAQGTKVYVRGGPSEQGGIVISVQDEGVGIPEDELEKLSQRFFRASTSTGISGTGIGLHLVKELIALHQGRMTVTSDVGKGTCFAIELPMMRSQDQAFEPVDTAEIDDLLTGIEAA